MNPAYAEMRHLVRRTLLSEIDLYQHLRNRRPHASRFAAWPITRAVVKDKKAAARRLRARLDEMIANYKMLKGQS